MRKGISDETIKNLCVIINEYKEKISQNQSQIEDLLSLIKENMKNDAAQELNNLIEQIKTNNNNSKDNFMSYIDDLNKLQRSYEINDANIFANLEKKIDKLKEE